MSDFFASLERDLVAAAARRVAPAGATPPGDELAARRGRRRGARSLPLVAALAVLVSASAAGGTLYALRGSVIPAPAARDAGPEQTPVSASVKVSGLRIADPQAGVRPWTVRVAQSRTGQTCSTVGQVDRDGRFGLVGNDGRFRVFATGVVDSCSIPRKGAATLLGARVFDAPRRQDARTVFSGVAPGVKAVTLAVGGAPARTVEVDDVGVFAAVVRGYPEDAGGLRVMLRFASGEVQRQSFGFDPRIVPDPRGGQAWQLELSGLGRAPGQPPLRYNECATFKVARDKSSPVFGPTVCGSLGGDMRHPRGVFFAVRRMEPGHDTLTRGYGYVNGRWQDHPPRTVVWGEAGEDIARIVVRTPDGEHEPARSFRGQGFLLVLGPDVAASAVSVVVTRKDGRTSTHRGDLGVRSMREALAP